MESATQALAEAHPLWERVAAFEVDRPDATLTFTARLARDNGWSRGFAVRVAQEYKRFMFLAVVADHVVTPSEAVDQAWHLHLVYTRSYWADFCGGILGKKIHHDPTTGITEQTRFAELYEWTKATYEHWFGHAPPADIWPPADVRFGDDLANRWVNVRRNWVIPRPRFLRRLGERSRGGAMIGVAAVPSLLAAADPFDFTGGDFLKFYGVLFVLALVTAIVARRLLRDDAPVADNEPATTNEIAFLAGGMERALHATITEMLQAGKLTISEQPTKLLGVFSAGADRRLLAAAPLGAAPDALERGVYEAASKSGGASVADLSKAAARAYRTFREQLTDRGLVGRHPLMDPSRVVPALIMLTVAAVGAVKVGVGISRDKPFEFLLAATIGTVLVSMWFLFRQRVTERGKQLVARLRERHKSLGRFDPELATNNTPAELAFAVALFGAGILATGALADTARAVQSFHYVHGGTGGGCGGVAGGCGTAGGGCGAGCGGAGCGGGGCGGCGA